MNEQATLLAFCENIKKSCEELRQEIRHLKGAGLDTIPNRIKGSVAEIEDAVEEIEKLIGAPQQ